MSGCHCMGCPHRRNCRCACSECGAGQNYLRNLLLDAGITEEEIGSEPIPPGVALILPTRPLTEAERQYAKSLR